MKKYIVLSFLILFTNIINALPEHDELQILLEGMVKSWTVLFSACLDNRNYETEGEKQVIIWSQTRNKEKLAAMKNKLDGYTKCGSANRRDESKVYNAVYLKRVYIKNEFIYKQLDLFSDYKKKQCKRKLVRLEINVLLK